MTTQINEEVSWLTCNTNSVTVGKIDPDTASNYDIVVWGANATNWRLQGLNGEGQAAAIQHAAFNGKSFGIITTPWSYNFGVRVPPVNSSSDQQCTDAAAADIEGSQRVDTDNPEKIDWPKQATAPLDEYHTAGIFTMSFPWLLPTPDGDPTVGDRRHTVGLKAAAEHLLKFAEVGDDGVPVYRFAADPRFTYYISDMLQRHQLNYQAGVFISQTPGAKRFTNKQLREKLQKRGGKKWLLSKMSRFVSKVRGSNAFWSLKQRGNLNALLRQEGTPTYFGTRSAAESYWWDVARLMKLDSLPKGEVWKRLNRTHCHVIDAYIDLRDQECDKAWGDIVRMDWYSGS